MKLNIYPLAPESPVFEQFLTLYHASFPAAERRPDDKLIAMMRSGHSDMTVSAIKMDNELIGLLVFWEFDDFIYIEHFATLHHLRGMGLGAKTLDLIKSRHDKPLVLEIEMPESSPIAARRLEFYRRNGFRPQWDFHYIQPPYSPELPSMRLLLMATGDVDTQHVSDTLHRSVYGVS